MQRRCRVRKKLNGRSHRVDVVKYNGVHADISCLVRRLEIVYAVRRNVERTFVLRPCLVVHGPVDVHVVIHRGGQRALLQWCRRVACQRDDWRARVKVRERDLLCSGVSRRVSRLEIVRPVRRDVQLAFVFRPAGVVR